MTRSTGTYRALALTICFALLAPASARGLDHLSGMSMDMSSMEAEAMDMSDSDESESRVPCPPTGIDIEVCCQATAVVQTVTSGVEVLGGWTQLWSIDILNSGWRYATASLTVTPPLPPPGIRKTPVHILNASLLL